MNESTRVVARLVERAMGPLEARGLTRPQGLFVLGYHRIDDSGGHLSVGCDDFEAHLEWLHSTGFQVVDVARPRFPAPGDPPCVAITFDDGYLSVAREAWPRLRARGWPATLYVVPGYLDGRSAFPWEEDAAEERARLVDAALVRRLASEGMTIGSHSMTHRYLPGLDRAEASREIVDSRRALEDLVGVEVATFSYPMGGYNERLRDLVAEAGYATAVTTRRGRNGARDDLLALRRPIVESDPADLARIVKGCYDFLRPFDLWRERRRQRSARPAMRAA
jgi:peptidoglycan/xylan/chitin deacetylase (PgdA/CDA1 family)